MSQRARFLIGEHLQPRHDAAIECATFLLAGSSEKLKGKQMTEFHWPNAERKIKEAMPMLTRGGWGDGTETVCLMSALVSGASSGKDCVTAGWPEWLSILNHNLFDATVGADDEQAAANEFALDLARAVQTPFDPDKARDLFLIKQLETGDYSALKTLRTIDGNWSQQIEAVERVVSLLHRRAAGEDVSDEMDAAADAADAARAAAYAASWDADDAAADAAYAAADAADAARAAAYATAYAAADVARAAADVACAARAAARTDLVGAIKEAATA
jgi:hypothetical protein